MKRFQESLKQKAHLSKIRNAKKTVPINSRAQTTGGKSANEKASQQSKLLLSLYDNKSFDAIPAYKLLRTAGLQQYTRGFIVRGYGINLGKLALINEKEKEKLYDDLKILPGHTVKLDKLIQILAKNSYSNEVEIDNFSQKSASQIGQSSSIVTSSKQSRKRNNEDLQYEKQLQRVINQYTPNQAKKKTIYEKISDKASISSGREKYGKTNYQGGSNRMIDFSKKPPIESSKSTIKKSAITSTSTVSKVSDESHKKNLAKILKNTAPGSKIDSKKVMQIDLQIDKVKSLYRSFDGGLMSSTIANIDLQQLIYSFAGYIYSKVIPASDPKLKDNINTLNTKIDMKKNKYQEDDSVNIDSNIQNIEDQVGQILRESYLHPLYRQQDTQVAQQIQGDQALSQGQNQEQPESNQNQFSTMQKPFGQSSFLGGESHDFGIDEPLKIFDQPEPSDIDYFKPTIDSIFNFIKNVVLAAKMQREIPIMAANYIETFLNKTQNFRLTSINFKRILVSSLLLASKIWDDQSFQSPSFAKTFPEYSTVLLNQMEKQILKKLEYKLKLDKKQYASTFFQLRKYRKANYKSYQNRKMNLNKIRQLQIGIKRQYKCQFIEKRPSF